MFLMSKNFQDLPIRILSAILFGSLAVGSIVSGEMISTLFLSGCLAVLIWEVFYIFNFGQLPIFNLRLLIQDPRLLLQVFIMLYFKQFLVFYLNIYKSTAHLVSFDLNIGLAC